MKLITQGTTHQHKRSSGLGPAEAINLEIFESEFRRALKLAKLALRNDKAGEIRAAVYQGLRTTERVKAETTRQLEAVRRRFAEHVTAGVTEFGGG